MTIWNNQNTSNVAGKESSASLPPPTNDQNQNQNQNQNANANHKSPNSSINANIVLNTTAVPSPPISISSSTNQSFHHQQAPVLPPPSTIGTGQPHMYQFPSLSNLNNLPRYKLPNSSSNSNVGQTTQLPSFNSISKGVNDVPKNSQDNIKLPPADRLLKSPSKNVHEAKLDVLHPIVKTSRSNSTSIPSMNVNSNINNNSNNNSNHNIQHQSIPSSGASTTVKATPTPTPVASVPAASVEASNTSDDDNNPNHKQLNVKDALYYLEQVKLQFKDRTDVYNNFLDIMKDFKSQNIDTPGVIERVSSLFKGHPKLIDGFNTFLPQGFSITCSTSDPNAIIVTTPMGTSIRRDSSSFMNLNQQSQIQPNLSNENQEQSKPNENGNGAQLNGAIIQQQQHLPSQEQTENHQLQAQPAVEQHQQMVEPEQEQKQSSPAEFNQAINYVNKIKQRYAAQPDIYKLFLENLQMYQKGLKPINEVYREISILFREAPDLLEDFKLFMPDNTIVKEPQPEYQYSPYYTQTVQLPPVGSFQSGPYPNAPINQQPYPGVQQEAQHVDPYYQQQKYQQQMYQHDEPIQSKDKKKKVSVSGVSQIQTLNNKGQLQAHDEFPVSNLRGLVYEQPNEKPALILGILEPVYPKTLDTDLSSEITFFDKVKKSIGNKQTYNEFLKLLKLYSSDVIDKSTLYEKAKSMIGPFSELFEWFKNFIGYEESPLRIENIAIKKQQIDLLMCKAEGPSYRQLPKSQTKMPCSGRDELCWSIFNDEWVGHPVWASEESGFIAHRKNQYEEMLFRIEDERHEYDYFMEANLRTIQTLETIANRMANMTPDEKAKFKLPVGLGHTSSTIYVKVIRKIYDKDRGWEVIDSLHENPAVTVPIVLKRLKQKDEEWKRVHREWNKVWREAEQKLLIKSLDHLGLSFKNIDKKLLTNKQLVSEISTIKQEQANKKLHPLMTRPKSELITKYEDFSIFMDILKLVNTNLKNNQVYSQNDKDRMDNFMKSFMIKFFFMDPQYIDNELKKRGIAANSEDFENSVKNKDDDNDNLKQQIPTLSQTKKRPREYDLLKDVLRKNKRKRNDYQNQQQFENETIDDDGVSEEVQKAQASWISNEIIDSTKSNERNEFNMFANTQIYVFYRHLDTLYKRLLEIKKLAPDVNKEIKSRVVTKFAEDLGLIDKHLDDLGISIKGDDSYSEALELCVKLIDNKIEQNSFEESLRNGFRNKAFKLFTIDRVIQSLMKHCHTIVSDSKCSEILLLMENDRNQLETSTKDQILYRVQVRSFMNLDENMFKITYNKDLSLTKISFLALEDLTIKDESANKETKWKYYLTSYSMSHPTEGLDTSKINLPFLKTQLESEQENENEIEGVVDSKLSVKIDMDTYRMRFEPESYDLFIRNSLYSKSNNDCSKTTAIRIDKLVKVINGQYGVGADLKGDILRLSDEKIKLLKEKGPDDYLKFTISPVNEKKEDEASNKDDKSNFQDKDVDMKDVEVENIEDKLPEDFEKKKIEEQKVEENVTVHSKSDDVYKEPIQAETTVVEGDSTIQQDETVEKVDI